MQQYRDRFGLPTTVLLVNPGTWATRDTDPWRRRYQQRAQAAGHADVAALLAASDDDHAARLLGVQTRTIRAMRSRRSADANGQA